MGRERVGSQKHFQGCDKQDRWTQRPRENQKTEMLTQEANQARGGSEANWCGPCSLKEGTQDCYEVPQKGEKCIPKRGGHHYQEHCKTYRECPLFLALLSKKPFQTPPERMALITTFCIVPSGETRQVVDESQTNQNRSLSRKPFRLQRSAATFSCQACHMALRKCWMGPVIHHTQRGKARPNPTGLLRIAKKRPISSADLIRR